MRHDIFPSPPNLPLHGLKTILQEVKMSVTPQQPEGAEVKMPHCFVSHRVDIILREQGDVEVLHEVFRL